MTRIDQETAELIRNKTAMFFANAKLFDDTLLSKFSEYVGFSDTVIQLALNGVTWTALRDRWLMQKLSAAVVEAYQSICERSDFNFDKICSYFGITRSVFYRRVSNREYEFSESLTSIIFQKDSSFDVKKFLSLIDTLNGLETGGVADLFEFLEVASYFFKGMSSTEGFLHLCQRWKVNYLRRKMLEVYWSSTTKSDFSKKNITAAAGVKEKCDYFPYTEWFILRESIPADEELLIPIINQLVEQNIPVEKFQWTTIFKTAGVRYYRHHLRKPLLSAVYKISYAKLLAQQQFSCDDSRRATYRADIKVFVGGHSIDLNSDSWNLGPVGGQICKYERLREDIRALVWDYLKEELRREKRTPGTISSYYNGFLNAAICLGEEVPDVKCADLEEIQRAWLNYQGTHTQRSVTRFALQQIFLMLSQVENNPDLDKEEIRRICSWIETSIQLKKEFSDNNFLSESEVNELVDCCLKDIRDGLEFVKEHHDFLLITTNRNATHNASPVVFWSIALIILLMLFSGLRGESILSLEVDDIAQISEDSYAIRWQHGKKREWQVGHLDSVIANLIQDYISKTSEVRDYLQSQNIFFTSNQEGSWCLIFSHRRKLDKYFDDFAGRHELMRDGKPLSIFSRLLRRTYVTRGFYQGISLEALKNQLGHSSLETLLRCYIKLNKFEHSSIVGPALDNFGRQVLSLWKAPLLLEDLSPEERASILEVRVKRDQGVGLCQQDQCVMAIEGSPPPCSLCRWLVTGKEFLQAWEKEYAYRKQQIAQLGTQVGGEALSSQLECLLAQFEKNYFYIKQNSK